MDYPLIFDKNRIAMSFLQKREGFRGQDAFVLPDQTVKDLLDNNLTQLLYVTDIGYYPNASFHFRERTSGCEQNILIYCVEGEGWFEVDGKHFSVHKNQYFIIPENTAHAYGAAQKNPWTIYWLHFAGEKTSLFAKNNAAPQNIDLSSESRYADRLLLFEEIYRNLKNGYSADDYEYASICLWHLLGSFRYLSQYRTVKEMKHRNMMDSCVAWMQENVSLQLNLHQMAEQTGLSESHFCLMFKRKTGQSPMVFFTRLKMQKACQMLDFSDKRIKEIAAELGYEDPYYFSRVFRQVMNISPEKYRNTKKG